MAIKTCIKTNFGLQIRNLRAKFSIGIDGLLFRYKLSLLALIPYGVFGSFRAPEVPLNGDRSTSNVLWNYLIGIGTKS